MTVRVLIADDHAVMREGLAALLRSDGEFEVVGLVADGREALAQAMAQRPDVLLMDVAMPGLNGIEAAALVRERCPGTRVVMLSMHADAEYLHRALRAGVHGYLLKESAGDEVARALRSACQGRVYLSAPLRAFAEGAAKASPVERLSARERQVLQLVAEGRSSAEIAAMVHLSPKSVETYRSRIMKKLGVESVAALVKFAVQHGITPPA